ncbi:MAG: HAD-IA family hydrolase [Burkholderiaceae bacterium]
MPESSLRALIFDVDGTLADTESAHRAAFNEAFRDEGLNWHWYEPLYTRLLRISGGKERIAYFMDEQGQGPAAQTDERDALITRLHARKTAAYDRRVRRGAVPLRPGVQALIESALSHGLRLAIATTTTPANIDALLEPALGQDWARRFEVIEHAQSAPRKKPDPQAYLQALARLQLDAQECLAFEDSANGLQAACAAGLATLVTPTRFTSGQDFTHALRQMPNLLGVTVGDLRHWHDSLKVAA